MNTLIILAALTTGQCSDGQCAVTVTVQAVPTLAVRHHPQVTFRRVAPLRRVYHVVRHHQPLRRTVQFFRHRQPVRTWFRTHRPVRRLLFQRYR